MTAQWVLIPCLKALFAELDRIAPNRDHASDGSVGDTAHQQEVSDHNPDETGSVPIHDPDRINEVHAIDVDNTLRESDLTMEKVVQFLLGRCRSGAEKRLRYIIYNRRIWSASSKWVQKTYTGASPHTEHAHFSASYTPSLEASTASWHLEDIPVALTETDKAWFINTLKAGFVAQGLRLQPNNLSDSERDILVSLITPKVSDSVRSSLTALLPEIAKEVVADFKIQGTATPETGAFLRNLGQVTADSWAIAMRGNTMGGDPIPEEGVFGQIIKQLEHLQAKVDALTTAAKE